MQSVLVQPIRAGVEQFPGDGGQKKPQQAAGQVVNAKVDDNGQLTTRKRRLLHPIHTHKAAIRKPNTETNAKDKTPTTTQPRHSDRVAQLRRAARQ